MRAGSPGRATASVTPGTTGGGKLSSAKFEADPSSGVTGSACDVSGTSGGRATAFSAASGGESGGAGIVNVVMAVDTEGFGAEIRALRGHRRDVHVCAWSPGRSRSDGLLASG